MNEQLIVKNFGPIKDATVDFKRVTVFIGPTGGGKSTLAKLAAVFRDDNWLREPKELLKYARFNRALQRFQLSNYLKINGNVKWESEDDSIYFDEGGFQISSTERKKKFESGLNTLNSLAYEIKSANLEEIFEVASEEEKKIISSMHGTRNDVYYIPADRAFAAAIETSLAGLVLENIALPAALLSFINEFKRAQSNIIHKQLEVPFLNISYRLVENKAMISISNDTSIELAESASGIQSVVPMLLVINQITGRWFANYESKSFIVEEPELNLFPLAQFELVKILVEKCAQTEGKNDLVLTTHSPYVLTALNLLCYAYRIAQQDEATAKKVAKLIPRHCWIDPDQFAAYYVDRPDTKRKQQVRSIINKKTGLIEENELDTASDELGAIFDKLVRLRKPTPTPSRAK